MKIVLATINARYSHTSFGLRYLKANLHEFEHETEICEFSLDESVQEIAEKIIVRQPDIVGLAAISGTLRLFSGRRKLCGRFCRRR